MFVGPGPEAIEMMGDKSTAKRTMRDAGVPLVPGSADRLSGADEARELAESVGYPVLLKAAAGGGGRGMRLVHAPDELEEAYRTASAEAQAAFGDGGMYLEKAVVEPRHVEMQVLADAAGGVLVLGERDCSIQRRHQKLIEEGPSPALDPEHPVADGGRRGAGVPGLQLRQRRHGRVPAGRRGPVLLHRDEHAAAGRAPGVGAR